MPRRTSSVDCGEWWNTCRHTSWSASVRRCISTRKVSEKRGESLSIAMRVRMWREPMVTTT